MNSSLKRQPLFLAPTFDLRLVLVALVVGITGVVMADFFAMPIISLFVGLVAIWLMCGLDLGASSHVHGLAWAETPRGEFRPRNLSHDLVDRLDKRTTWMTGVILTALAFTVWFYANPVSAAGPAVTPAALTPTAASAPTFTPTMTPSPTVTFTPTMTPSPTATPSPMLVEDTTCYHTDDPPERYNCFIFEVFAKQCFIEERAGTAVKDTKSRLVLEEAGFVYFYGMSSEQRLAEPRLFNEMYYLELGIEERGVGWCHIGVEKVPGTYWSDFFKLFFVRESDMAIVFAMVRDPDAVAP